jgi:hypothetical protein
MFLSQSDEARPGAARDGVLRVYFRITSINPVIVSLLFISRCGSI